MAEVLSLCWDNFHQIIGSELSLFLEHEDFVDVTLAVQGKYIKAHKIVLSICSPYFKELFKCNPCQHPIIFMRDISYQTLVDLLTFMYKGETKIKEENLSNFIKTAEALEIKALMKASNDCCHDMTPSNEHVQDPAPKTKENAETGRSNKSKSSDKTQVQIDLTESDDNPIDDVFEEDVCMTAVEPEKRKEVKMNIVNCETVEEYGDYYEYIANSERSDRLVFHHRIYLPCKRENGIMRWKCFKPDCGASCQTKDGKVIAKMGLHNHPIPKKILSQIRKEGKIGKNKIYSHN